MASPQVRFSNGAGYDLMMGPWSRAVGEIFLDWLQPAAGLAWVDVGCGSGAFTSLVIERCAPSSILGIDPSPAQLEFAQTRGLGPVAHFEIGDAMALGVDDNSVDIAAAALVVHFMPDPARGVAEMARVVRPGGLVATYAWDLRGGGFPYEAIFHRMGAIGSPVPDPPHPEAAGAPELHRLWTGAGLESVSQREITVTRTFRDFDDYWDTGVTPPRLAAVIGKMPTDTLVRLKNEVRADLPPRPDGSIVPTARANAIQGRVPRYPPSGSTGSLH